MEALMFFIANMSANIEMILRYENQIEGYEVTVLPNNFLHRELRIT
jgi:hypothetical protein